MNLKNCLLSENPDSFEREVKYSHLKINTFSAQLHLCNKGPFPPDLLGTLAIFNSPYGFNKLYLLSSGLTEKCSLFSSYLH